MFIAVLLALASLLGVPAPGTPAPAASDTAGACQHRRLSGYRPGTLMLPGSPQRDPVGIGPCSGARPGAWIAVHVGEDDVRYCTLNFAYVGRDRDPKKNGVYDYMGTAGHCVLGDGGMFTDEGGERTWSSGPVVRDINDKRIGTVAYAVLDGSRDFALIRIDEGVRIYPQMCSFGGPTGINDDRPSVTTQLRWHGQGTGIGWVVPGRTAVAKGMPHPRHVYAFGPAISGDSGSGVTTTDGRAVGVMVTAGPHYGRVYDDYAIDAGTLGISRLPPLLRRAENVLDQHLTLRTAPLIDVPEEAAAGEAQVPSAG